VPDTIVTLRAARIPYIGFVARHHWLEVTRGDRCDRWEVWQRVDAGGDSWGYLHRNLLPPGQGVGNGPSWLVDTWEGEGAEALAARIEASIEDYPWCHRYWFWPGPNSNTYVQWVLDGNLALGRKAPGKWYASRARDRHGEIA
jgi:hypothetical protein